MDAQHLEHEITAAEFLGRAYAGLSAAACVLKSDFRSGKYGEEHYEALEEELARIATDTLALARTLGWVKKRP